MDPRPRPRATIAPQAAGRDAPVALPEGEGAVGDWRRALADYLKALQELGDQRQRAGAGRDQPR
jgi:hypothetical protein